MCDVYGEACFSWARVEKIVHGGKYTDSLVKILGTAVSKEGNADTHLWHERTCLYWFPFKRCNCKQCFLLPTPMAKVTLFIEYLSLFLSLSLSIYNIYISMYVWLSIWNYYQQIFALVYSFLVNFCPIKKAVTELSMKIYNEFIICGWMPNQQSKLNK